MSAFLVKQAHIAYLVNAAVYFARTSPYGLGWLDPETQAYHKLDGYDRDQASRLGQVLWDANVKSVSARYRVERGATERYEHAYARDQPLPRLVQVLKAVACLEYQACEYDGWERSEARAALEAIKGAAIHALPGYQEAQWEVTGQAGGVRP